ncbi:MAG: rod shape-determining protein MreD [Tidjanibacter sp.]|nr:rod shape-determining protein MreD [Tidjanibacter sp.]
MQRTIEYILFFVLVVLLQALFFDNLMLSGLVVPLYYIVFVVLLPVKIGRFWLLVLGALLGATMDVAMGTAGLNTIATTAVAYLRPVAMNLSMGKDVAHEIIPYGGAITRASFVLYATMLIVAHELIFFGLESLGAHVFYTLAKVVLSSAVTLVLTLLSARLFRQMVG